MDTDSTTEAQRHRASPIQIERIAITTNRFFFIWKRTIAAIALVFGISDVQDNAFSVPQIDPTFDFKLASRFSFLMRANHSGYLFAKLLGEVGDLKIYAALCAMHSSSHPIAHVLRFNDFHLVTQVSHD